MSIINLIYYLLTRSTFGALALKMCITVALLAGALRGASILSISRQVELQTLWKPVILITFSLIITGLVNRFKDR